MPAARRKPKAPQPPQKHLATSKPARFGARLTEEQKALFERAAALTGRSLTDFVISAAQEAANRTVQDFEILRLSERNSRALMEALLNPPLPGPRLREAARWYKEQSDEQPGR
jgi:uncharacterized protein (DUF1778 family)